MRISDWSSDVCSSDLTALRARYQALAGDRRLVGLSWRSTNRRIGVDKSIPVHDLLSALRQPGIQWISLQYGDCAEDLAALRGAGIAIHDAPAIDRFRHLDGFAAQVAALQLGRASCRERVVQYVEIPVVAGFIK